LGVSVVQFLSPLVVTASIFGVFGGAGQTIIKNGISVQVWTQNAAFIWVPWIESLNKGKAHGIRQKAGTNDPITYFIHNYNTGLDTSGTLLTVQMTFYTDTDTVTYYNKWKNDTVLITSDSAEFKIEFPSTLTSLNGHLHVRVGNGVVTLASKTGYFASVPLPVIGTPVPFAFPLQNLLNFNYNLGNFGNDSLQVIINMFGNSINNHTPAGTIHIIDSVKHVPCFGTKTGAIYVNVSGLFPPFTYLWNNGATVQNKTAVKAGTYTVTVTDSQGNTLSKTFVVNQPAKLAASVVKNNVKCGGKNTGSITLNISGGTPAYSVMWSTGETTPHIDSLYAGTYIATITDANGCTLTKAITLTENAPLSIAAFSLGADSAIAFGAGGITPYVYRWFTSPAQSTQTATGLIGGGIYKVRVTDSKSCTATIMYTHPFSKLGVLHEEPVIKITPNPASQQIAVQISAQKIIGALQLKLKDVTGKTILIQNEKTNELDYKTQLDVRLLTAGIYFIECTTTNSTTIRKFIKE
ncbi:MAG TPA: T9SS type A sorting domain-containing protein, partial [Bacteroidia bacterium]|nr:T9SS type A sorting domain-containing protein [Bacteroidia bacterium]